MTTTALFDLDGTLVDTPRGIVETFTAAFTAMGLEAPRPEDIRATIGLPWSGRSDRSWASPPTTSGCRRRYGSTSRCSARSSCPKRRTCSSPAWRTA
ncbi:HAD family hydrolase [Streptomyces stramineus]